MISEEEMVRALRAFHTREGRPPTITEWIAQKYSPSAATIAGRFGGWGAALAAADLPRPQRIGGANREKVEETAAMLARLEKGEPLWRLARDLAVTPQTLSRRLKRYCDKRDLPPPLLKWGRVSAEDREAAQLADRSRCLD